jgi:hypothetical protein
MNTRQTHLKLIATFLLMLAAPVVLAAQGKTLEEAIATKPTAEFDARVPQAAQTTERFLKPFSTEIKAGR